MAPGTEGIRFYSMETLTRNFYALAIAISVSNACATSCLDYASTFFGNRLGGFSSGALFAGYAVTSFFFSKALVTTVGPKNGLICGVTGYSVYVCGFLLSNLLIGWVPGFASFILLCTSVIGGVAGGVLWTSQGLYFTRHSALYAQSTGQETDKITADFSAIFAVVLLGAEMTVKLGGSAMFAMMGSFGGWALAILFIAGAVFAVFVIMRVKTLDMKGAWDTSLATMCKETGAVAREVYTDKRVALLLPFQMAFGLASSFVPYYIYGTVVSGSPSMGISAVGLLSALVVFTGAASAVPIAYMANLTGKFNAVLVGGVCLILTAMPAMFFSATTLGTWGAIIPLVMVFGVGRGVWETINKAVFVDFFGNDYNKNACAFSAATFANGYATGMAYVTYAFMSVEQMTALLVFACSMSLLAYGRAFQEQEAHTDRMLATAEAESRLDVIRQQGRQSRRTKMTLDRMAEATKDPIKNQEAIIAGGGGRERSGSGRAASPAHTNLSFSMGHGGISLITGNRGNSHEDLMHAFKSVATHKIGGGIGGALGNFSSQVGKGVREGGSAKKHNKNKKKDSSSSINAQDTSAEEGQGGTTGTGHNSNLETAVSNGGIASVPSVIDEEIGMSMDSFEGTSGAL
jgi:hypothetical protein